MGCGCSAEATAVISEETAEEHLPGDARNEVAEACEDAVHESVDIAIIGAGLSGGYLAHRLRSSHPQLHVQMFEATERVGGRLMSKKATTNKGDDVEEFGGMRIFPQLHKRMMGLLSELGLDDSLKPYKLSIPENFFFDSETLKRIPLEQLGPDLFTKRVSEFDKEQTCGETPEKFWESPLHKLSVGDFWDPCPEDRAVWDKTLGYDNLWNASAALWQHENEALANLGPEFQYKMVLGWQSLVRILQGDTPVAFNRRLVKVTSLGEKLQLQLADGAVVLAKKVFLTLPLNKLVNVEGLLPAVTTAASTSIDIYPGTKCFLRWDVAWWQRDFGLSAGRSISTLATRMVYYWDADTLLVYTAGHGSGDELRALHDKDGMDALVARILHDLSLMHYGEPGRVPEPADASFKAWSMICTWWKKDIDVPATQALLSRPCGKDIPVWFANSTASSHQGWMEGALEQCDNTLESFAAAP